MGRFTLARSLRLALLGLTIVLAVVAAAGVAYLYSSRQDYEDRISEAYQLQTAASRLLAAEVVEADILRAGGHPRSRAAARSAFAAAAEKARDLARFDQPSDAAVAEVVAAQRRLRADPRRAGSLRSARSAIVRLDTRQRLRLADARHDARNDSRKAVAIAVAGGALALIAALALVAAMAAAIRRPLDELVAAARRLAAGELDTRVSETGPAELRTLAMGFNAMAAEVQSASERLDAERRRLDTTIRSLNDALVISDPSGIVEQANPRTEELLPELREGASVAGILPALEPSLAGEQPLEVGGRTLLVTASLLEDGAGVVWTIRDATERVRLERLKSEFVATASHELRSPLTSIKGFVELLDAEGSNLNARQRDFVEIISHSTNRLVDLVNDLLDVARVEAGRVEIHRRPIDLGDPVREVTSLMAQRFEEKAQELEVEVAPALPPALADPARMRQILTNLLTNAHLYTETGGTIRVAVYSDDHHVVLQVSDDGRGMTEEEINHAFDRFYRGRDEGTHPGTGLGLAIVRSLVDLHGGDITLSSAPDQGTTFTVRLPLAPIPGVAPRHALRGRRVLVVDDEPEIAELIAQRLAPHEVESVTVNSGAEALERLQSEHFDAVTLDILMPGMSGFEVLRILRADPELRGVPVVIVSVFAGREVLAGEWVVPKPIDADELVDALGQAILAGRVRVIVVARRDLRDKLEPTLEELGIEHEWTTDAMGAAQLCQERFFEAALVDAGLHDPSAVLRALDLRGRRLRRSVVVFSSGGDSPGLARLDAEPVAIEDAGATVLGLLQPDPGPIAND